MGVTEGFKYPAALINNNKKSNNRVFGLYSTQNHKETIHRGLGRPSNKNVQLCKIPADQFVSRVLTGPLPPHASDYFILPNLLKKKLSRFADARPDAIGKYANNRSDRR